MTEVNRANCWNACKTLAGGVRSPFGANQLNRYVMAALERPDGCISIPVVHLAQPDQAISAL